MTIQTAAKEIMRYATLGVDRRASPGEDDHGAVALGGEPGFVVFSEGLADSPEDVVEG